MHFCWIPLLLSTIAVSISAEDLLLDELYGQKGSEKQIVWDDKGLRLETKERPWYEHGWCWLRGLFGSECAWKRSEAAVYGLRTEDDGNGEKASLTIGGVNLEMNTRSKRFNSIDALYNLHYGEAPRSSWDPREFGKEALNWDQGLEPEGRADDGDNEEEEEEEEQYWKRPLYVGGGGEGAGTAGKQVMVNNDAMDEQEEDQSSFSSDVGGGPMPPSIAPFDDDNLQTQQQHRPQQQLLLTPEELALARVILHRIQQQQDMVEAAEQLLETETTVQVQNSNHHQHGHHHHLKQQQNTAAQQTAQQQQPYPSLNSPNSPKWAQPKN